MHIVMQFADVLQLVCLTQTLQMLDRLQSLHLSGSESLAVAIVLLCSALNFCLVATSIATSSLKIF
jgi:hypothetical protein